MDEVFHRVDAQLHASAAFQGLAEEARYKLSADVRAVAGFLRPRASPPRAGKGRSGVDRFDRMLTTRPDMLPEMVGALVTGTLQAVVDASALQMRQYAALMAEVAGAIEGVWADAEQRLMLASRLEQALRRLFAA